MFLRAADVTSAEASPDARKVTTSYVFTCLTGDRECESQKHCHGSYVPTRHGVDPHDRQGTHTEHCIGSWDPRFEGSECVCVSEALAQESRVWRLFYTSSWVFCFALLRIPASYHIFASVLKLCVSDPSLICRGATTWQCSSRWRGSPIFFVLLLFCFVLIRRAACTLCALLSFCRGLIALSRVTVPRVSACYFLMSGWLVTVPYRLESPVRWVPCWAWWLSLLWWFVLFFECSCRALSWPRSPKPLQALVTWCRPELQWPLRLVRDDFSVFVYKSSSCNCWMIGDTPSQRAVGIGMCRWCDGIFDAATVWLPSCPLISTITRNRGASRNILFLDDAFDVARVFRVSVPIEDDVLDATETTWLNPWRNS